METNPLPPLPPPSGQPNPLAKAQPTQGVQGSSAAAPVPPYTPNVPLFSATVSLADALYFIQSLPPTPAGQQPTMQDRMAYRLASEAIMNFNAAFTAQYGSPPYPSDASPFSLQIESDITTSLDSSLDPRLPPATTPPTTLLSLARDNPSGLTYYLQLNPPIVFPSTNPMTQSFYPNGQTLAQTLSQYEALSPTQQPPGFGTSLPPSSTGKPNPTMLQLQDFYNQFLIIINPNSTTAQQDAAMNAAAQDIIDINTTLTSLGGIPAGKYAPANPLDPMCQIIYWSINNTVGRDPSGNPISLVQAAEDIVNPPNGGAPDYSTFQSILVGNEQFIEGLNTQISQYYYTYGYGNTPISE